MKRIAVCTIILGLWASTNAQEVTSSALLRCLAQEEAHLHREKRGGPQYKLNQLFFNEWSGYPELELLPQVFERVCANQSHFASLRLLREFMISGQKIFRASKLREDDPVTIMRQVTLSELRRQMPQVFFTYIADIEFYAPTASCLDQSIPALAKLKEQYRYLESEASLSFLDDNKKSWEQVFKQLESWTKIFQACQENLNKKKIKPAVN